MIRAMRVFSSSGQNLSKSRFCHIVTGFEKRGHFAQNAIFCHFSTYHHFKAVKALGFRLGLLAVWAFYFTDPTLESPVPSGEPPKRGIKRRFSNAIDAAARTAHTGSGRGP